MLSTLRKALDDAAGAKSGPSKPVDLYGMGMGFLNKVLGGGPKTPGM